LNPAILEQIQRDDGIPTPPNIVTRLIQITNDPNFKTEELVKLLSTDPGIASAVLRLANSALFAAAKKTASVSEAVVRLGVRQMRALVLAHSMIQVFRSASSSVIDLSYFWRRSLAAGVLAARFADELVRLPRDLAFTSALLGDVGVIILAKALPETYGRIAQLYAPMSGDDLVAQEKELLSGSHAEVSALALERWGLPEAAIVAVRHHHSDQLPDLPAPTMMLAKTLNGAGEMARLLCETPNPAVVRGVCKWVTEKVGISEAVLPQVLKQVESDIGELASALKVEIVPSRVYALIADVIAQQLKDGAKGKVSVLA
jgi:HD-like signal output (HDOD) protein